MLVVLFECNSAFSAYTPLLITTILGGLITFYGVIFGLHAEFKKDEKRREENRCAINKLVCNELKEAVTRLYAIYFALDEYIKEQKEFNNDDYINLPNIDKFENYIHKNILEKIRLDHYNSLVQYGDPNAPSYETMINLYTTLDRIRSFGVADLNNASTVKEELEFLMKGIKLNWDEDKVLEFANRILTNAVHRHDLRQ